MKGEMKMEFVLDLYVEQVLKFAQVNVPAGVRVDVMKGAAKIAPFIWGDPAEMPLFHLLDRSRVAG